MELGYSDGVLLCSDVSVDFVFGYVDWLTTSDGVSVLQC